MAEYFFLSYPSFHRKLVTPTPHKALTDWPSTLLYEVLEDASVKSGKKCYTWNATWNTLPVLEVNGERPDQHQKKGLSCALSGSKCCLDFAEKGKRLQHLYEKCKSCTERTSRLKARLSLLKNQKWRLKMTRGPRPSQALDWAAGLISGRRRCLSDPMQQVRLASNKQEL